MMTQAETLSGALSPKVRDIWAVLDAVNDPEVPALSVTDLGIIRDVRVSGDGVHIDVTPTYTGCPATELINLLIREAVEQAGHKPVHLHMVLSPPWTTDWISDEGKKKLKAYGIAPPEETAGKASLFGQETKVSCPKCDSAHTQQISEFGSTACKALYQCRDCHEPFEYFKCI